MAVVAKKLEKTVTVKITRALADAIARQYRSRPLSDLYSLLEPWVKSRFAAGLAKAGRGDYAEHDGGEEKKYDATVRILRSQVRRLKIVAPVYGRSLSEMLEEKLWQLL